MLIQINIPTYNRQNYLLKNLEILNDEINKYSMRSLVKVCVYDNNDFKETLATNEAVTCGYGFQYIANGLNIGSDQNIYRCYTESDAEYTWVLGDDDFVLPNELFYIINLLDDRKIDLLVLRPSGFDTDYIREVPKIKRKVIKTNEVRKYTKDIGGLCTFISSIIIKSKYGKSVRKEDLIGTNLIQVGVIIKALSCGNLFARTIHYSISCKRNNSSGYISENVFVFKFIRLLKIVDCPTAIRSTLIKTLILKFYPQMFLVRRINGNFSNYRVAKLKIALNDHKKYYYLFIHPVIYFSRGLAIPYGYLVAFASRLYSGDMLRILFFIIFKIKDLFPK